MAPVREMSADLPPEEEGPDEVNHRSLPDDGVCAQPEGQKVELKRSYLNAVELDEVDQTGHQV